MAIVQSIIVLALIMPTVLCCKCMARNNTEQICQADFAGTVLLKSRRNDDVTFRYVYQAEIGAVFRANFDIPSGDNRTTVRTAQHSATCGMPLTVRQDATANIFFMATGHDENTLSISTCSSLICRWKDIGDTYRQHLSKEYVAKACACKWNDQACISTYNFDFVECTNVDWD